MRACTMGRGIIVVVERNEWNFIVSMLPVVANTLLCEVPIFHKGTMPRVVPDQREKFENDELFRKLSRESEVRAQSAPVFK